MIGKSTAEYIFIRASILYLHSIAPVSVIYCVLRLFRPWIPSGIQLDLPIPVQAWLMAEAIFFITIFLPHRYFLQNLTAHVAPISEVERNELFRRCNDNIPELETYLSGWFMGAKLENIRRDNVKDFLKWGFFNGSEGGEQEEEDIESYTRQIETLLGRRFPPGRGSAQDLGQRLEKLDCLHRSLFWYLCIFVVDASAYCSMMYNGFYFYRTSLTRFFTLFPLRPYTLFSSRRSPVKHLTYWYRPHKARDRLPVLFIHGIGVGLYPYTNFLRDLVRDGKANEKNEDVGVIALEIMPVSSRITHPALRKDEMASEIQEIVKSHGWDKFVLVSHSYGSVISTHLIKSPRTASLVGPVVFIDPVCFLLHLPDVAYNFTARQPVYANEHQLWYFASKDVGVANTLAKRFFWSENIIWKEDLNVERPSVKEKGRKVTVVLSGQDLIVDTETVGRYLLSSSQPMRDMPKDPKTSIGVGSSTKDGQWKTKRWTGSGLEVLWYETLDHAQVFDSKKNRRPLVEAITSYSRTG